MLVSLQLEQKASCDDYLSLIYLSIDAVTEGMLLSEQFALGETAELKEYLF